MTQRWAVVLVARGAGGSNSEQWMRYLASQLFIADCHIVGRPGAALVSMDTTMLVTAPSEHDAELHAHSKLQWMLGANWVLQPVGQTMPQQAHESERGQPEQIVAWWNELSAQQQAEALTVNAGEAMPVWMMASLSGARVSVWPSGGAGADAEVGVAVPRSVARFLERRRLTG